jgi:hypothetical protein
VQGAAEADGTVQSRVLGGDKCLKLPCSDIETCADHEQGLVLPNLIPISSYLLSSRTVFQHFHHAITTFDQHTIDHNFALPRVWQAGYCWTTQYLQISWYETPGYAGQTAGGAGCILPIRIFHRRADERNRNCNHSRAAASPHHHIAGSSDNSIGAEGEKARKRKQ